METHQDRYPLSREQKHLLLLCKGLGETGLFNLPVALEIKGPVNLHALQDAIRLLVSQHDAFRTTFIEENETPVQIVSTSVDYEVDVVSFENCPEPLLSVRQYIELFARLPLSLSSGPLFRVVIARVAPERHIIVWVVHHIVCDGWSIAILVEDMLKAYKALSVGIAPQIQAAGNYQDYVSWQKEWLKGQECRASINYWLDHLMPDGATPAPRLKFPEVSESSYLMTRFRFNIDEGLSQEAAQLGWREGSTPFVVLITALMILIYFETNDGDVRIGALAANRSRSAFERTIGHFVNTILVRAFLKPEVTNIQALRIVREAVLQAYEHQKLPLEVVIEELDRRAGLVHGYAQDKDPPALFRVLISFENISSDTNTDVPFKVTAYDTDTDGTARVTATDLDLMMAIRKASTEDKAGAGRQMAAGLEVSLNIRGEFLDMSEITRFEDRFTTILRQLVAEPHQNLMTLREIC